MAARYKRQGKPISQIVLPALKRAAVVANGRATRYALEETRRAITAAGLGRLGGAVGSTSTQQRSRIKSRSGGAVGIIYARGSDESRANQTLLAYSEGASIFPTSGKKWLAFPTSAIPTRVGRRKMTPALYRSSGLVQSIGKLRFVPDKGNTRKAYLVASKVTVSRRTGRAKSFTGKVPRGSDKQSGVVAFVLLKFTKRAQRFDQQGIMRRANDRVSLYAADYLASGNDR